MRQATLINWADPKYRERVCQGLRGHAVSGETREKIRQAALGRKFSPQTRERMRQTRLGKKMPRKGVEKTRQANLGRKRSPETREKIRQARLGTRLSPETRERIRQAGLGRKHSPETRKRMRQARLRQTLPIKMTSIERLLRDEFKKRRLKFEMHKTMFGRFQPDFVFEGASLIVQADGDFWHGLPNRIKTDHAFNEASHNAGWTVWRFGEKEIHMHAPACARAVARFVRDHH